MMLQFGSHASDTRVAETLNIYIYKQSSVFITDEFQCLILPEISYEDVVIIVLQNVYIEAIYQQYIDFSVLKKKPRYVQ